ncbi:cytochrome C oxidase subunit IV family protein [Phaeodactylibacter sp.]|uniref:cytochrome C oxidase subunit IV family protein n=1 Tax=Phaeodactylibacter sp. TaxID=1940289 RepID=UPI0025DA9C76|nr:cytochrome C oxidase subunit IV family protein [Phaeodactylibacter sp.]MCI4650514.1 cytochrome C oxidase subunit IV family protein [Phaeodactylibacter sp.]MCI5091110.1 cytochrome C oxidase subunit IV family protein [Phaeodactylibacter sp.]
MGHLSYEDSKKLVYKGLVLLAVVTLVEVFFSLLGKGHVIGGLEDISWLGYLVGLILIGLSLYKAYYIIYEFMHMRYEVKGLALSVLLPTVLLVWALIAFFQEGTAWKQRRQQIEEKDKEKVEEVKKDELQGFRYDSAIIEFKG